MKKIVVFIALAVLCFILSACGTKQEDIPAAPLSATDADSPADGESVGSEEELLSSAIEKITLSGNAADVFTAEDDCYAEGEEVILYFAKGVNIRGDMLAMTEAVMDELTALTGMNFANNCAYNEYCEFRHLGLENSTFKHVNPYASKINVVIAYNPDMMAIQSAYNNGVLLDESDYDYEQTSYQALYHELAHLLHLRNSANVGSTLNEGYAVYISYEAMKAAKLPPWSHLQFFYPYSFDESIIKSGESGFRCQFDPNDDSYQYGFRLVMFLEETYGEGTFIKIADAAARQKFDSSYDLNDPEGSKEADTKELKELIISQTSDDVFRHFSQWYSANWDERAEEYHNYMKSIGLDF